MLIDIIIVACFSFFVNERTGKFSLFLQGFRNWFQRNAEQWKRDCATRCSAFLAVCMFYMIGFVLDG